MISVDPHQHLVKFQPLEMRLGGRHQAEQFVAATGVDVNYEYLLSYVLRHAEDKSSPRVLDFGCGNALLVRALLDRGVQCFGAEIFYGARDHRSAHMPGLLSAGIVRQIPPDGRLPFDDDYFDIIFSNQVFEHVEHLDTVVTELSRVLRPNGMMYHHFPSQEVLREGHFGIPFSHWIRSIATRRLYMLALRRLGLGCHKRDAPSLGAWADRAARYIEDECFYRPYAEIRAAFTPRYRLAHREIDYIRFRARGRRVLGALADVESLTPVSEAIFRRLGFMAIELVAREAMTPITESSRRPRTMRHRRPIRQATRRPSITS